MQERVVSDRDAGQRLDKYLKKLLREAPDSFVYRMLRKKNITLNGKKAEPGALLASGDVVKLFLSDETIEKFSARGEPSRKGRSLPRPEILYEDKNILLANKPCGILSQPDQSGQPSMVEILTAYLLESGAITSRELETFHPGVCNRLDRNTSGLIAAGKTMEGLAGLSAAFHDRTLHKIYLCLAAGHVSSSQNIKGYLHKDEKCNKVYVHPERNSARDAAIETRIAPLAHTEECSLLMIRLMTGKTHQIRAHLAGIGHPLIGDAKYGLPRVNREYQQRYGLRHQLLHAWRLELPQMKGGLENLSGLRCTAPLPPLFCRILADQIPFYETVLQEETRILL